MTLVAAVAVAIGPSSSIAAGDPGVRTITSGLDAPFGLASAKDRRGFVVAESESGQVTRIKAGRQRVLIGDAGGVAGVATSSKHVFAVTGGPSETGEPSGGKYGPSRVIRMDYNGKHVKVIANLLKYELRHNPDGQVQLVNGKPVDALSNPFAMTYSKYGLFVADGGANDVLKVNPRTGKVSTFFAPPTVKDVPACQSPEANANPGTKGCDPVPTGVQVVGKSVYISTLGAEAPGAGRVYKLNARTGKIQKVWKGLTAPTGIAVRTNGTIFVSEVLFNAPQGPPPAGFSPADIGRITRLGHGHRTHAKVTMPTGLVLKDGRLYASTWSIASFMGIQHAGKVVQVRMSAFK